MKRKLTRNIGMEDAHTAITSYADTGASFFAVFDGHGGRFDIAICLKVV
jgi:serine/threonine protein phosphatase PrpC